MASANFKSVQKFFHVYLPIAIIVFSILWIGAMTMEDFHEMLHDPIYIIGALIETFMISSIRFITSL